MKCQICNNYEIDETIPGEKIKFSRHLQFVHKMTSQAYTEKHILGHKSLCVAENCQNETRYESFSFRKYCKEHALLAQCEGGKNRPKKETPPKKLKNKIVETKIQPTIVHIAPEDNEIQVSSIANFVTSLGFSIIRNTKQIIPPLELDIFIPEKNVAIEYNGLYWHSFEKVGKNYHQNKIDKCNAKNIKLIHIFSDEWIFKQSICESMIKHRLGISKNSIMARKCEMKEISNKLANEFFDRTHISGKTRFCKSFALFFNDQIVSCLSLKRPVQKKYEDCLEISRFSNELNANVQGAFSKLFKYAKSWSQLQGFKRILTYADLRFGPGFVYKNQGFELIGQTSIMYWYAKDELRREFRFKYRAQPGKPEKVVAEENGVWKVYGTKNNIYKIEI